MDFALTEEQEKLQKLVHTFVEKEVVPAARELDERGEFPAELFQRCGALGLFGLRYPESVGGSGGDFVSFCLMAEQIARGSLSLAAAVAMQGLMGTDFIYRFGSEEQRIRLLSPALRGEKLGTIAMTEPDFGSDLGGITTRASRDGSGWVLTGRKMWITSATAADFFTVAAKTRSDEGLKGIDFFLVEKGTPGLSVGKRIEKLGVRASETSEVILEQVRVPENHLLGEEGTGFQSLTAILAEIRTMTGALALGLGEAALQASRRYAGERVQFGRPIASFQAISHKIALMATELEAARALVYRAAWQIDRGNRAMKLASMAKLFSTEVANRAADECTRIFGSYGFAMEYEAQRYFRDARFLLYGGGTNEVLKNVIAKELGV